jgi:hypothetical protein
VVGTDRKLTWFVIPLSHSALGNAGDYLSLDLSLDEKKVAVERIDPSTTPVISGRLTS